PRRILLRRARPGRSGARLGIGGYRLGGWQGDARRARRTRPLSRARAPRGREPSDRGASASAVPFARRRRGRAPAAGPYALSQRRDLDGHLRIWLIARVAVSVILGFVKVKQCLLPVRSSSGPIRCSAPTKG